MLALRWEILLGFSPIHFLFKGVGKAAKRAEHRYNLVLLCQADFFSTELFKFPF